MGDLCQEEPKKLDLALYRLGAKSEENICSKDPNRGECHARLRVIYDACPAKNKKIVVFNAARPFIGANSPAQCKEGHTKGR